MIVKTIYISYDGEEFETEEECEEYEREFEDIKKSVLFLSDKMKPVKDDDMVGIEAACYFKVLDWEKANRLFDWLVDHTCMDNMEFTEGDQNRIYAWDEDTAMYYDLNDYVEREENRLKKIAGVFWTVENEL